MKVENKAPNPAAALAAAKPRPAESKQAEESKRAAGAQQAKQQATEARNTAAQQQKAAEVQKPKPTVNTQGQTTGQLLHATA